MDLVFSGARLLAYRHDRGLSQYKLAIASGVTPGQILNWEKGKTSPYANNLVKLAAALQCSMLELFEAFE